MGRDGQDGRDLRDLVGLLRRRAWLVVLSVLVVGGGTYLYSRQLDEVFEASVLVVAQPTAADIANLGAAEFAQPSAQNDAATARLAMTSGVAEEAARQLGAPRGSVGLAGTSVDEDTGFILLTAKGPTGKRAVDVANAFADALSVTRTRKAQRRISETVAALLGERNRQGDRVRRAELLAQARRLSALRAAQAQNLQVIEPARIATQVAPDVQRNTIVGAILGLLVGIGLMGVGERLDRKVRRPEELEDLAGVPLLATIPKEAFPNGKPTPAGDEAFRTLRDSLTYFNVDRQLTSVLVASPLKGDGKTTVAVNLAVALARADRRVVLVDADLRHPQVAARLGLPSGPGLSDVLSGTPLATALQPAGIVGAERLRVLAAGGVPPNPSELLGSRRMAAVLEALSHDTDVVVLDTAPVLVVSDALPLLDKVSGVVALANLDKTPRDAVARMLDVIATAGGDARVLGVVATGAGRAGRYGYGYGYGTYGDPAPAPPTAEVR